MYANPALLLLMLELGRCVALLPSMKYDVSYWSHLHDSNEELDGLRESRVWSLLQVVSVVGLIKRV